MITRVKKSTARMQDITNYISTENMGPQNSNITVALQAALTAGTPVFIATGTWLISTISLPANAILFGAGKKSILKQIATANTVAVVVGSDCQLSNFLLDGNKVNQVGSNFHGFDFTGSSNVEVSGVTAFNNKGTGFYVAGAANEIEFFECIATGWTESGFRMVQGSNVSFNDCKSYASDAVATGDGIAIASNGATITGVTISNAVVKNNAQRGISLLGSGSKNVIGVSITNPRVSSNISHGFHAINADSCSLLGGSFISNGGDGVRIEGDVQNCRFVTTYVRANTGFGIREVTSGSTPNFNGLIYTICNNNVASNVITKVGASSYIV